METFDVASNLLAFLFLVIVWGSLFFRNHPRAQGKHN